MHSPASVQLFYLIVSQFANVTGTATLPQPDLIWIELLNAFRITCNLPLSDQGERSKFQS